MTDREEEALRRFAVGIATAAAETAAGLMASRIDELEADFAELLAVIMDNGDARTVAAVGQLLADRQPAPRVH